MARSTASPVRTVVRLRLLAPLLLAAFLVAVAASSALAQESAAPRWEYARLSLGGGPSGDDATLVAGWVTPEESVFVPGGAQPLAERLAARLVNDTEDSLVVLLGEIGARGWELVAVVERETRREYYFKRPLAGE